jgi:hypothetical protein
VAFDGGGGVSEGFGDDGDGRDFGEFVEGSEPGCSAAEGCTESFGEAGGSEVLSG